MIETLDLKKSYGDGKYAVKGVSFRLDKKITSIIGRNGAGKTTLIRMLSTQLLPSSGTAIVDGHDIVKDAREIRKIAVSIPQEAGPIGWITAIDNVRNYLCARGMTLLESKKVAENAMRKVGLWNDRSTFAGQLSGGMKRKMFVAMAIAADAQLTFLDEPTTGLDPLSRTVIWAAIKEMRGQVILTTHYMEEAQSLSDEVLMIEQGKTMAQGSVGKLLKPLEGMVRIESSVKRRPGYKVGYIWVSYLPKKKAEASVMEGDIVKPVTLDDLFIRKGVNLES